MWLSSRLDWGYTRRVSPCLTEVNTLTNVIMPPRNATGTVYTEQFTEDIAWRYPFLPGEPDRQVRNETVVCITSEPYLTGSICANPSVNGSLIYAPSGDRDFLTTTNATSAGNSTADYAQWYWCRLDYYPFDQINRTVVPAGDGVGPASIEAWESVFERMTSQAERDRLDIVFGCRYSKTDGIGGVRRYFSAPVLEAKPNTDMRTATAIPSLALGTGYLVLIGWHLLQSLL